jgi:hypothetical protein
MIRIEPAIRKLRGCGVGIEVGARVDWWRQTSTLWIVELSADIAAFRGGRRFQLRIGFER